MLFDVFTARRYAYARYLLRPAVAGCHTPVYCINTAKPTLKLFQPSGSPIILVSSDPCADTQFQGNLFTGGDKYTGVGKMAIFDGNRRLSRKRYEIGQ